MGRRRHCRARLMPVAGVLVGALVAGLRQSLIAVSVRGDSLRPALADGQRVLVWRSLPESIERGAIVVGRMPEHYGVAGGPVSPAPRPARQPACWFVKVLVGRPGDLVTDGTDRRLLLKDDEYWVEGLADCTLDSREWGPVPGRAIVGRVVRHHVDHRFPPPFSM